MGPKMQEANELQNREVEAHYSKKICSEIKRIAQGKEIAVEYGKGKFGQRPMVVNYPGDVVSLVKAGARAFHCSVETWRNPMELKTESPSLDSLRTGWDYLIDIDSNVGWEFARQAALVITERLEQDYGITDCSIKFSGRRGFHIIVPFETFPKDIGGIATERTYPELPRKMTEHLKNLCRGDLEEELADLDIEKKSSNPYAYAEIDSAVFTSRHMFRMPYSFHLGTYLISIPLDRKGLKHFKIKDAKPENVKIKDNFFCRETISDATEFIRASLFEYECRRAEPKEGKTDPKYQRTALSKVAAEDFPPCIKKMLQGMSDGRKRAAFLFTTYLLNAGWRKEEAELQLIQWNEQNKPPLRRQDLLAPLKGQLKLKRPLLPPNCSNQAHYKEINVCEPDGFCARVKNPLAYTILKISKKRTRRTRKRKNDNLRDTKDSTKAGKKDK